MSNGSLNSIFKATAVPTTPVKSVAIMAISLNNHRAIRRGVGKRRAIAWARSVRVVTPSLIDKDCIYIAIKMAVKRTTNSW